MAQTIPHAFTSTEIYNSIGPARRATFVAWRFFSLYEQMIAQGSRDAVRMLTNLANTEFAPDGTTKILTNTDAAQIIALLDQLDSPVQATPKGVWSARTTGITRNGSNLEVLVDFINDTQIISRPYITGNGDLSQLPQWAKNIILAFDQQDAATAAFVPGPVALP
jgi:hypothetical protein